MTVTATGHLPPDTNITTVQNNLSRPGTPAMKTPSVGSPVPQLNEAATPGRGSQVRKSQKCTEILSIKRDKRLV